MSEFEKWAEEYHDRARRERTARQEMELRAEAARQEKELAVEHERAVLAVRDDFGGRIHELEAENETLKQKIKELESQVSKAMLESVDDIKTKTRATYLSIIAGLYTFIKDKKTTAENFFSSDRRGIPKDICDKLETVGLTRSENTIRKIVNEIKDLLQ